MFYLDWLMGYRKDFYCMIMERLGKEAAQKFDWSGSRLICIAGDFQKWDEYAIKQMNRTIDLVRYRRYGDNLLLLEQLTANTAGQASPPLAPTNNCLSPTKKYKTVSQQIAEAPPALLDLYHAVADHLQAAGDDVQVKATDSYIAFRRLAERQRRLQVDHNRISGWFGRVAGGRSGLWRTVAENRRVAACRNQEGVDSSARRRRGIGSISAPSEAV